jgi:hypothetical protein
MYSRPIMGMGLNNSLTSSWCKFDIELVSTSTIAAHQPAPYSPLPSTAYAKGAIPVTASAPFTTWILLVGLKVALGILNSSGGYIIQRLVQVLLSPSSSVCFDSLRHST